MQLFKKYWFRPKTYGYGYVPIAWEGWLATLALMISYIFSAYINDFFGRNPPENMTKAGIRFLLDIVVFTSIFHLLFKDRVQGTLKWRWGKK